MPSTVSSILQVPPVPPKLRYLRTVSGTAGQQQVRNDNEEMVHLTPIN